MTLRQFNENIRAIMVNDNLHGFSERLAAAMELARMTTIDFESEYNLCPRCSHPMKHNRITDRCPHCNYIREFGEGSHSREYNKSKFNCAALNQHGLRCKVQVKEDGQLCYTHKKLSELK